MDHVPTYIVKLLSGKTFMVWTINCCSWETFVVAAHMQYSSVSAAFYTAQN